MSRTYKDAPYPIWMCHRLGVSVPANWADDWYSWPHDPAVGYSGRTHRTITAAMDAGVQRRYRSYVRDMIHHGRWDDILPPKHLPGWDWWY